MKDTIKPLARRPIMKIHFGKDKKRGPNSPYFPTRTSLGVHLAQVETGRSPL